MAGLKPLFKPDVIKGFLEENVKEFEKKTLESMKYAGERFVAKARLLDTYKDRTGNLRASIGYVILRDGHIVFENFLGGKGGGKGEDAAKEIAASFPNGLVLIGVAGMNYAAAVESRGYDVITGSDPSEELKSILNEIKW